MIDWKVMTQNTNIFLFCDIVEKNAFVFVAVLGFIYVLCHNCCTNHDSDLFSTSKWPSEPPFCKRFSYRWHKNGHLVNDHFTTISGHFCAIYMKIFHKMEVQTVNLRCWTSLNHDWYNSDAFFSTLSLKKRKWKYLHFES